MMTVDTLQSTVTSLQELFSEVGAGVDNSAAAVCEQARRLRFPDPELAARVAHFLPRNSAGVTLRTPVTADEVSEAFLRLLIEDDAQLPQGNFVHWRAAVREAARNFGDGLTSLYESVRDSGLGFNQALLELAEAEARDEVGSPRRRAPRRQ